MLKKLDELLETTDGVLIGYLANKSMALVEYDEILVAYEYKNDKWVRITLDDRYDE